MTEPGSGGDRGLVVKDAAYFNEVRKALGRGAPTVLLGTSKKKLDRIVARLAAEASIDLGTKGAPGPVAASTSHGMPVEVPTLSDPEVGGYGSRAASYVAGITQRQLEDWVRADLVQPSVSHGSARLFGFRDLVELMLVKRLLDTGIELEEIKTAVMHLRSRSTGDLAQITLMSDGVSVYECTSPTEVVDLLASGQGIYGIAVSRIRVDVEAALASVHSIEDQGLARPASQPESTD